MDKYYISSEVDNELDGIIAAYKTLVDGIDEKAINENTRSYGGIIRAGKGELVESISRHLIELSWYSVGGDLSRLEINSKKFPIKINLDYIEKIKDEEVKNKILENISDYTYGISVDNQVFIDANFVLGMECKAYTENAMMKRILFDFHLLKTLFPNLFCYLLQLESQLGGDYSELNEKTYGSNSTHTLMSYMPDVDLKIITLLKGERKVDEPIHKEGFNKTLEKENVLSAMKIIKEVLIKFI